MFAESRHYIAAIPTLPSGKSHPAASPGVVSNTITQYPNQLPSNDLQHFSGEIHTDSSTKQTCTQACKFYKNLVADLRIALFCQLERIPHWCNVPGGVNSLFAGHSSLKRRYGVEQTALNGGNGGGAEAIGGEVINRHFAVFFQQQLPHHQSGDGG